jgi:protein TonB
MMVVIDRSGELVDARLNSSSGYVLLDKATLAAARAVERYPRAPSNLSGAQFSFAIPIRFEIR